MEKAKKEGDSYVTEYGAGEMGTERSNMDLGEMDGGYATLHYALPDFVKHPVTGERLNVIQATYFIGNCLRCRKEIQARELQLDQGISVVECPACRQFIWFTRKEK